MSSGVTMMLQVSLAILYTFVLFGIGAFAVWRKMIPSESIGGWSDFTISVLQPCLIFYIIRTNCSADELTTIWQLPAIGFGITAVNAAIGWPLTMLFFAHDTRERQATARHMLTTNNFLYLPLIIVGSLWHDRAVYLLLLMHVGSVLGLWTIGIAVMSASDWRQLIRKILSPNFIAVIVALIFVKLDIGFPDRVMEAIGGLGEMSVTLALILIGASIFNASKRLFADLGKCFVLVSARDVVIPLVTIALIMLLPISPEFRRIAVVVAAMPASCLSVLIMHKYGGSPDLAGQVVVFSHVVSLITVPLIILPFV
ncbi:MAG: AEC family transporter [Victivallaceae bacterium]|nr:AEC family transporter [Victivallaceae bacterium]